MTAIADSIQVQLRKLPLADVMAVYADCLTVIHEREEAEGLDPQFCREIEKRLDDIDAGTARGVDAYQALREM